ncbi:hypothetical protein [Streptomyces sp. NPDC054887]
MGGVARVGQEYAVPAAPGAAECLPVVLEGIQRYENVHVDLFGAPHAAKVRLSGPGVRGLRPRLVVSGG